MSEWYDEEIESMSYEIADLRARVAVLEAALRDLLAAMESRTTPDFTVSNRMHAISVACDAARAALAASDKGEP